MYMSSNYNKKENTNSKKTNSTNKPKDSSNGKPPLNSNKFKFNINWLYIALIAVIIGIQFLGTYSKPKEIDYDTFEKKLFLEKDVEKLIIVNKESAEVYIKKDKLKTDKYKEEIKKGLSEKAPQYVFSIGTIETLNNNIENTRKKIIIIK